MHPWDYWEYKDHSLQRNSILLSNIYEFFKSSKLLKFKTGQQLISIIRIILNYFVHFCPQICASFLDFDEIEYVGNIKILSILVDVI